MEGKKSEDTGVRDFKGDPVEVQSSCVKVFEEVLVPGETSARAMAMEAEFDELVEVRHGLDKATDQLNICIEEFEQRLRDCNPGVSAWVEFEVDPRGDDSDDAEKMRAQLGFYRTQEGGERGWHLVVVVAQGAPLRLIRAPRAVRVAATTRFRDLVNQITKRSKEMLEDVETATKRLQTEL